MHEHQHGGVGSQLSRSRTGAVGEPCLCIEPPHRTEHDSLAKLTRGNSVWPRVRISGTVCLIEVNLVWNNEVAFFGQSELKTATSRVPGIKERRESLRIEGGDEPEKIPGGAKTFRVVIGNYQR